MKELLNDKFAAADEDVCVDNFYKRVTCDPNNDDCKDKLSDYDLTFTECPTKCDYVNAQHAVDGYPADYYCVTDGSAVEEEDILLQEV